MIEICYAVVEYETKSLRRCFGLCSSYLAQLPVSRSLSLHLARCMYTATPSYCFGSRSMIHMQFTASIHSASSMHFTSSRRKSLLFPLFLFALSRSLSLFLPGLPQEVAPSLRFFSFEKSANREATQHRTLSLSLSLQLYAFVDIPCMSTCLGVFVWLSVGESLYFHWVHIHSEDVGLSV